MAAFKGAGKKPGIEVWRVEKMEPVLQDAKTHGQLYSGDCYIIMKTIQEKTSMVYDLFFWLGKDSTQDEQGAVAYHTVTLDDSLGGKPVQYREVQGSESTKFMAVFPKGVQYMDGGVASAFKHVEHGKYESRLFHLKGKRNVRMQQVALTTDSLNEGDVFILDLGLHLYQWNGHDANKYEKFKGLEIVTKIKDEERGGKAEIHVLESGKNDNVDEFWKPLGGHKKVKSADEGGSDDVSEKRILTLYTADGKVVAENKLEKSMLDTHQIYYVYTGDNLFVWLGKGSDKEARKKSMIEAGNFLKANNIPASTPVARINETGETPQFKANFAIWDPPRVLAIDDHKKPKAEVAADTSELYKSRAREEEKMATTEGRVDVWRIENMDKKPLPKEQYGEFFMGDSYIVQFTYKINTKDKYILYFWQGRDSSNDEKGASALLVKDMDDKLNHEATQVRVVQGKEPNHFLALFKGKMVVHTGGHASAFKNRKETESYTASETALYHVRGTTGLNTRANQVPHAPASLNSGDCFILLTTDHAYVWIGLGANGDEKAHAVSIGKNLAHGRKLTEVQEEHESEEFWAPLGGKGDYPKTKTLEGGARDPRLFQCHDHAGGFRVEEIFDFSQDDLINEDVMMLDTFDEVFVWIGRDSNQKEKDMSLQAALDYIKNAPDGRSADTPVFRVQAGAEPPNFTCHFLGWNDSKALDFSDPYLKKLGQLNKSSGGSLEHKGGLERVTAAQIGFKTGVTFPVDQLRAGPIDGVDPSHKEQYLSDAEFQKLFKCSKDEFNHLPAWKQSAKKKENNLF